MDNSAIKKAYDRYSKIYDLVFGAVFNPGRKLAVELINKHQQPPCKILEVGVGTGLSLPSYRRDFEITGIDISEPMLELAKKRCADLELNQVKDLLVMDAENLAFPDHSFDVSIAMYVVSVVTNPQKFLDELCRVTKPNGDIYIINHFLSEHPIMRSIENSLAGLSQKLGFRPNFTIKEVLNHPNLVLKSSAKTNICGYFKLLHLKPAHKILANQETCNC